MMPSSSQSLLIISQNYTEEGEEEEIDLEMPLLEGDAGAPPLPENQPPAPPAPQPNPPNPSIQEELTSKSKIFL